MKRIKQLEEISMNSWPSLQTIHYDGWIIRFANGLTKRSNSINAIYDSNIDVHEKIEYCEKLYKKKNLPVCFKISDIVQPPDLDKVLELNGYKHVFDVSVQSIDLKSTQIDMDKNASIIEVTDDKWIDDYVRMNEININDKPILRKIIDQIIFPKCLLTYYKDGLPIGCGLGVVDDRFIGLFDIVIDKKYRNLGLGKLMINSILKWGKMNGADTGYLQVLTNNLPALRLYEKIGFIEEYKYWYRIKGKKQQSHCVE